MHDIAVPSIETTHRVLYLCTYVRVSRFWWIVLTQNFTAAVVCWRLCEMFFAYCFEKDTDVGGSQRKHECVLRMKVLFLALNEAVRFACVVTSSRCRSACSNSCFKSSLQSAARSHSPSGLISGETEGCVTPLWSHHCCFVFFNLTQCYYYYYCLMLFLVLSIFQRIREFFCAHTGEATEMYWVPEKRF